MPLFDYVHYFILFQRISMSLLVTTTTTTPNYLSRILLNVVAVWLGDFGLLSSLWTLYLLFSCLFLTSFQIIVVFIWCFIFRLCLKSLSGCCWETCIGLVSWYLDKLFNKLEFGLLQLHFLLVLNRRWILGGCRYVHELELETLQHTVHIDFDKVTTCLLRRLVNRGEGAFGSQAAGFLLKVATLRIERSPTRGYRGGDLSTWELG